MSTLRFRPIDMHLRGWARRVFITVEWLAWIGFFAFALSMIALRYMILPSIESYRGDIEHGLSKAFGAKVTIGEIRAGWQGLRPDLDLADVKVLDQNGRPALALPAVSLTISWWSVPRGELRLHQLDIAGADLDIRRLRDGRLVIGGIELGTQPNGRGASDWILNQRRIHIRESRLRWNDETRTAPELALSNINLVLENFGKHHRLGLTADPPRPLASRIDLRADLVGASLDSLKEWQGEVYANLAYIDLAAWRAWLDYPADIHAGSGGVRAWAGFKGDRLEHFTADVALSNAAVRLRGDLPLLELSRVSGRVGAREIASGGLGFGFLRFGEKRVTGFEVSGKQVALATFGGVALSPADFNMKTLAAQGKEPQRVELEANSLDLEPLARLIEHLPLDLQMRKTLVEFNPRGSVYDFKLNWRGEFDKPQGYTARGRFVDLALDARGKVPGFANLSGTVDATEKGGTLYLASKKAALLLPHVFEEPRLDLDSLNAQAKWAFPADKLEIRLDSAAFANADAAGTASGVYRVETGTPGYVDIQARINRAEGKRVARYMPITLGEATRTWLKHAIETGHSDDARLTLRGNLGEFPFLNPKQGLFRVTVKARDTSLHYADGWPRIEGIKGDILFERNFMEVHATAGTIQGTKLSKVDVKIPDLAGRPHMIEVQGNVDGSTNQFLDFINASPVDKYIDGFTETMRATGTGKLALKLSLPIEEMAKLKVSGQYQFINADLRLDEGLPTVSKVNGAIDFTEKGVTLRNLRGEAVGGPFTLNGATRPDGVIALTAQGNFTAAGLRTWLNEPLMGHLTGGAAWRGAINLRKKAGDITIESNLVGVATDLPAPLAKAATDPWPLKITKAALPRGGEDEIAISLERVASVRMQRRPEGNGMVFARGAAGIGEAPPAMPRAGLALNMSAARIDVDEWRRMLDPATPAPAVAAAPAGAAPASAVPAAAAAKPAVAAPRATPQLAAVNLRAEVVTAFGRAWNQVRMTVAQDGPAWVVGVNAREISGDLNFRPSAAGAPGQLTARLKNLIVTQGEAAQVDNAIDRATEELPSIDITVDNLEVNAKKLGKLQVIANDQGGEWRLQKVHLENPDGTLDGSGAWRVRQRGEAKRRIDLKFSLDTHDSGKLLDRLGFPGTVRGGAGYIRGEVGWDGSPLAIDYPSLRGNLEMRTEKGQFLKADPGAGKLLGIMSLQALPRRLTLDFRDVFTEGFAFDLVSASSTIERGVLSTKDFKMAGVSAAVVMSGEVDLVRETQNLKVVVLPDLSGGMGSLVSILLGLNPLIAITSYVAQRALKDPLSKAFSFEYAVSGTWADPKIARIQAPKINNETGDGSSPGGPSSVPPATPPLAAPPTPPRPPVAAGG